MSGIPIIDTVLGIIKEVVPSAKKRQEIKKALIDNSHSLQSAMLDYAKSTDAATLKLNIAALAKKGFFHSGWRPLLAWYSVLGWIYTLGVQDHINYMFINFWDLPPLPPIRQEALDMMVYYLLGYGGYRTFEKVKGIAKGM